MSKRRIPIYYYSIELSPGQESIDHKCDLEVVQFKNDIGEKIFEMQKKVKGFNLFLRRIDANAALKKILKTLGES